MGTMRARWQPAAVAGIAATLAGGASSGFATSWEAPDVGPIEVSGSRVAAIVIIDSEPVRRELERAGPISG